MFNKSEFVEIGKVGKAHGVHGSVNFYFNKGMLRDEDFYKWFFIEHDSYLVPYRILELRYKSDSEGLVLFEDIDSQSATIEIIGKSLFVYLNEVAETSSIETLESLIGFSITNQNNIYIGIVVDILENPGNPNLVVEKEKDEYYIPINEDLVLSFNAKKREIVLEIPEGLIEIND